jgi:hypothetical protein
MCATKVQTETCMFVRAATTCSRAGPTVELRAARPSNVAASELLDGRRGPSGASTSNFLLELPF